MIDISVTGLIKSFDLEKKILDGITFQIDTGERVGLLGKNGAGKTTLFRILTGELDYDAGEVSIASGRRLGLISQIPVYPEGYTVEDVLKSAFSRMQRMEDEMNALSQQMASGDESEETLRRYGELSAKFEGLGGYDTETPINKVANGLSIPPEMRERLFDTLSGGEKTRVNLGRLILEDTDILLLDEPTNHLDLHAIEWLEQYLSTFKGTVVAISHDRYFLDRTITRVIEVLDGKAEFYSGNYSFYAVEKERRYLEKMRQYEKEQAKIAQLEKSAEQLRMFAFKGMDKTYRRALSMEKRIERMRTTDKPTKERALSAQFKSQEFYGDEVFALKKLKKSFGDRVLFHDVDLQVRGGERIALIGDNGTGKSTLIKMLMEEEYPDEGKIKFGPSVRIAYLPQIVEFDVPERNLVDTMLYSKRNITPQSARNRLAAFHFTGEDVFKSVSVLSGGELSRLKLCILMDEEVNLLILDEPTNHLDNAMLSWLENYLKNYRGTVFMVTHDRYFLDKVSNRILEISHGKMYSYDSNYSRFLELKAEREEMELASERKRQSILRMELEWAKRGCRARSTKQRARLERLEVLKNGTAPTADAVVEMDAVETRMGKKTIEFHNVSKAFGDKTLMKDFEYIFLRNQSVGIIGPNGCGKSTMLRMITGEVLPDAGTIEIGDTIRIGYLAQEEPDMDTNQRVIDYVKDIAEYVQTRDGRISASQMLERFLFTPDMQYTPLEARVLDVALLLHAEHGGGNNSTFTTHVVTSSGTDTYSAIAAALGSLKGPKHGGANIKVVKMFEDIKEHVKDWNDDEELTAYLRKLLHKEAFDKAGLIYGMGHAVYSLSDPRAKIMARFVEGLSKEKGRTDEYQLYANVERLATQLIAQERKIYKGVSANVDFYSGFIYSMLDLPMELYTPIFAIARIAGWSAHRMEELIGGGKIIRPAYMAVQPHRDFPQD